MFLCLQANLEMKVNEKEHSRLSSIKFTPFTDRKAHFYHLCSSNSFYSFIINQRFNQSDD